MALMEKFVNLTLEQQEKYAAVKDIVMLDALIAETGVELTAEEKAQVTEYIEKGMLPLDDDDLDTVAGGAAKNESPALAAADGRIYNLPSMNHLCVCHHENKWARSFYDPSTTLRQYFDIKCYKCKKTWSEFKHNPYHTSFG